VVPALEKLLGFSLRHCLLKTWEVTDLFVGGSHGVPENERLRVARPYGRVDRAVSGTCLELDTRVAAECDVRSCRR
jgi:hypothetical protein